MTKKQKLPTLSAEHKEALAKIAGLPEFSAFEALLALEENNIIISSFKENSSSPILAIRKAWHEGRIFELRTLLNTFSEVKKDDGK